MIIFFIQRVGFRGSACASSYDGIEGCTSFSPTCPLSYWSPCRGFHSGSANQLCLLGFLWVSSLIQIIRKHLSCSSLLNNEICGCCFQGSPQFSLWQHWWSALARRCPAPLPSKLWTCISGSVMSLCLLPWLNMHLPTIMQTTAKRRKLKSRATRVLRYTLPLIFWIEILDIFRKKKTQWFFIHILWILWWYGYIVICIGSHNHVQ